VYRHSPGALYPALRRLVDRELLSVEETVSEGGRRIRVYRTTDAGLELHLEWLRRPVDPATIGNDLALHLMRFAMMEGLDRSEVAAFLKSLADALDGFVTGMESYLAGQEQWDSWFGTTAVRHGIAVHRASLEWARQTLREL
jgi:DNA-binding MarR family transcriptional regulator